MIATVLTMSRTSPPRERSFTALRRPCFFWITPRATTDFPDPASGEAMYRLRATDVRLAPGSANVTT